MRPPEEHQLLQPAAPQFEGGDRAGDEGRADRDRHLAVELLDAVGQDLARVGTIADFRFDCLGRDRVFIHAIVLKALRKSPESATCLLRHWAMM